MDDQIIQRTTSETIKTRLTKREVEVLCLIIEGLPSHTAAEQLCVSKRTIDFHLANVYQKLRVTNRLQAARQAARLGLLPSDRIDQGIS